MQARSTVGGGTLSIAEAAKLIYSEGGVAGFYRGIASPLLSLVILNTLNFSAYAQFRQLLGLPKNADTNDYKNSIRIAIAASCVGPFSALISTPFEYVKTQMQLNVTLNTASTSSQKASAPTRPPINSSIALAYTTTKNRGLGGLYVGHAVNTTREMVFLATYFSVYEHSKSAFIEAMPATIAVPVAGGFSGSIGWFVSFPLDCIKANIQGRRYADRSDKAPKAVDVARVLLRTKGVVGLYAGVMPSIARAFLVSSSRFSAYEFTMWVLGKGNN